MIALSVQMRETMISKAIYNTRVKTEQIHPLDDLSTYVTSKEMARQNFARQNGDGVLISVLPGGSDYFLVQHQGDRVGVYCYDELTYSDPDTSDAQAYTGL